MVIMEKTERHFYYKKKVTMRKTLFSCQGKNSS